MSDYYVGVDLGGTNLRCAVIDTSHKILARHAAPTNSEEGVEAVIDRMASGILEVLKQAGINLKQLKALCMGVPGPLDQLAGIVHDTPNMVGWKNVPISAIMKERLGVLSFLENDANCAGWGEFTAGAGRGCRNMMMITLGTGIGGALIIDSKLFTGRDGTAGELGHVCLYEGGRKCGCGARGCIEAYASATATVARFIDLLDKGWRSPLSAKRDFLTCEDIFNSAKNGDPVALHIVEETGYYLGVLCADVANLLNPERTVISGGMIQAGAILFDAIRKTCRERGFGPGRNMDIIPAELSENAGLIGAAGQAMVRYRLLQTT